MTIYWGRRSYTEEQFREAWENSVSIAEVARKLGLTIYGSTHKTLRHAAKELGLSDDHLLGQGWNVGLKHKPSKAKPIEEVLVEGSNVASSHLKSRLFKEGLLDKKCAICDLEEWLDAPAPLALDHINGINNDNRIENLRILCYNCHGQTDTFCRGQKKNANMQEKARLRAEEKERRRDNNAERLKTQRVGFIKDALRRCKDCQAEISRKADRCKVCAGYNRKGKIDYPDLDVLIEMIISTNYSEVGRTLGCTDNAVRKYLKRRGVDLSEL